VRGINGASGVRVSPDGAYVYVTGEDDDALAVFARDATTGTLRFLEVHDEPADGVYGVTKVVERALDVAVSPDGTSVYVVGPEGTLAVFALDTCGNGIVGADEQCDDNNVTSGDGCSEMCRLELCGSTPIAGCRTTIKPGEASLEIRDQTDDKDQLSWKWRGETTTLGDFGDPTTTASYVICVYDSSLLLQPLLSRAALADGFCDRKPCWKASSRSYKYTDQLLTPDGLKQVQLREGLVDGKAKLQFLGIGRSLFPPTLPLTPPVTVQVANTQTNVCWEAVYSTADKNNAVQFKAKSD